VPAIPVCLLLVSRHPFGNRATRRRNVAVYRHS
jgi:hypothetical protein